MDNYYKVQNNYKTCDNNQLKDEFFSNDNIRCINKSIVNIFLKNYNIEIPFQRKKSIYHYCYLVWKNNSLGMKNNLQGQLARLNNIVISKIIPNLLESIEQRKRYINDLNKPFELNDRPISSTSYVPNKSASNIIHYDKDNSDNNNFKFVY